MKRPGLWAGVLLAGSISVLVLIGLGWWLTAPTGAPARSAEEDLAQDASSADAKLEAMPLVWPETRLQGKPAKRLLLAILLADAQTLEHVPAYTATFHKQERIGGELSSEQTMQMKVRQQPFAVYLKYLKPEKGKEVVYCEGKHENKVIAHGSGLAWRLLPRVAVAPTSPIALAENRHPITDAGLFKLTTKLIHYRRMDVDDPEAETVLDRVTDSEGRLRLRSIHTHPHKHPGRPFARVEVLYDPDTLLPVEISSYDWPAPGQTGPLHLAEHYSYENVQLSASLSDVDFDPSNPAYSFRR